MYTASKAMPVISILNGLAKFHGKKYCYPSQLKIIELIETRLGIKISIATLNRWLRAIEDDGFITRMRRIRKDKKLGMVFQSTLYTLKKKSYVLLAKMGLWSWDKIKKMISEDEKRAAVMRERKKEQNGIKNRVTLSNFKKRHPDLKIPN